MGTMAFLANLAGDSIDTMAERMRGAKTIDEKFEIALNSLFGSMRALGSAFKRLAVTIAETFAGDLKELIKAGVMVIDMFTEFISKNKHVVIYALKASAVLIVLGAALVALGVTVMFVGGVITGLGAIIGAITTVVTAFAAAWAPVLISLLLIVAAIEVGIIAWQHYSDEIKEFAQGAIDSFNIVSDQAKRSWGAIVRFIQNGDLEGAFNVAIAQINLWWTMLSNSMKATWESFASSIDQYWTATVDSISLTWAAFSGQFKAVFTVVINFLKLQWENFILKIKHGLNGVIAMYNSIRASISRMPGGELLTRTAPRIQSISVTENENAIRDAKAAISGAVMDYTGEIRSELAGISQHQRDIRGEQWFRGRQRDFRL